MLGRQREQRLARVHRLRARQIIARQRREQRQLEQLGERFGLEALAPAIAVDDERDAIDRGVFEPQRAQQVFVVARAQDRLIRQQQRAIRRADDARQQSRAVLTVERDERRREQVAEDLQELQQILAVDRRPSDQVFRQREHEESAVVFRKRGIDQRLIAAEDVV